MNEATIRLHIGKLADGGFLATSVDVPGLVAEGAQHRRGHRNRPGARQEDR